MLFCTTIQQQMLPGASSTRELGWKVCVDCWGGFVLLSGVVLFGFVG